MAASYIRLAEECVEPESSRHRERRSIFDLQPGDIVFGYLKKYNGNASQLFHSLAWEAPNSIFKCWTFLSLYTRHDARYMIVNTVELGKILIDRSLGVKIELRYRSET